MNVEQKIVAEALRIAAKHGRSPTPFELREITNAAVRYHAEGMDLRRAVDCAATLTLRLFGQRPPWV